MSEEYTVDRAWCKVHYSNCYWAYNKHTGDNRHIGDRNDFHDWSHAMKQKGFHANQHNDVWSFWRRNDAPLSNPAQLDWIMAMEEKMAAHPEQDW